MAIEYRYHIKPPHEGGFMLYFLHMNNTLKIASILAVVVIGAVAILWILGVASIDQLTEPMAKTIGIIVVGAAVIVAISAIGKMRQQ